MRTAAIAAAALPVTMLALRGPHQMLTRPAGVALVAGYVAFVALALT